MIKKNPFPAFLVINERKDFIGNEERIEGKKKSTVIRRIGNMLAGKIPSCLICFSV